ncbi:transporter [Ruegeria sp. 2205SS24-7]|uniref:transporter n=1 Tax=Ruegeria discodermiae TaxID=3064389 RepID=UPI0027420648|nr:transporter [Ruegeria sp. 2205SS24-7]MDP5216317.1 transporter [Ruegeria sp. 2205SS24-7]
MKKPLIALAAAALSPTLASAGGLDRSGQGINIIFEEGDALLAALAFTSPRISGSQAGTNSGNVGKNFFSPELAYKKALNDKWDVALIYDKPFGADIAYSPSYILSNFPPVPGGPVDPNTRLSADADTDALTGLARYKFNNGFSGIGGVRLVRSTTKVTVPAVGNYEVESDAQYDFGYVVGVAWEKPEIAARVALTYNSKVTIDFDQTETIGVAGITVNSQSQVELPQSVNLDFQTGVAQDTLVFGTIRWVDWPQLEYDPPNYPFTEPLVSYEDSIWTFSLGLGRSFTDEFAGAITVGYEPSNDVPQSNLSPTDGFWNIGIGGTYTLENAKISGGIRYTDIGDATTTTGGEFKDNHAWSVGFQVTYALGNS